jgi:UDP-2,4-diacetamido-2,4,6-trideoxy-beta-L-altropyranose hydrolase
MRCLALAQAWQDAGGRAVFAMAAATPAIQARLAAESCPLLSISCPAGAAADANQTAAFAREQRSDWIAVDGYQFSADYQRALRTAGFKVLFLDDYGHARHYSANLVLNQNVSASPDFYVDREPQTKLLLGTKYCLLRREFGPWREWTREVSPVCRRVLVMMGGSDPENVTARVIEALRRTELTGVETAVVVGGSNRNLEELQSLAAQPGQKVTVHSDVSNMAEMMSSVDVAISAAGSTCWELCAMGLPALLIDIADNQTNLAKELDRRGCAIRVGDRTVLAEQIADHFKRLARSYELRQSLSQRSRELVDGGGAMRVVSILFGTQNVVLRRVRADDVRLLWEWANDPEVRAASFSPDPIPWKAHETWFAERLRVGRSATSAEKTYPRSLMLIADNEDARPLGQIRFDARTDGEWEVDLSIAKEVRGRGIASQVITLGVQVLLEDGCDIRIHSLVKPTNVASVKAFERAGFKRIGIEKVRDHAAIHLIYCEAEPGNQ